MNWMLHVPTADLKYLRHVVLSGSRYHPTTLAWDVEDVLIDRIGEQ
jgi:hypothetical protein